MQIYEPHNYQNTGFRHIIENPKSGLFLDMGLGKTVITLTAIEHLAYERLEVGKVLIIAPRMVCESTWQDEAAKWVHTSGLSLVWVNGTEKKRIAALKQSADIYLISRDLVAWLCAHYGGLKIPFDMVVLDESSSFKSSKSQRFKSLRVPLKTVPRVVLLTGTPSPNGLQDLWSQLYLIDGGERLYKHYSTFEREYFNRYEYSLKIRNKECEQKIYSKVGDICLSMKAADYLDLPPLIDNVVKVRLSKEAKRQYDEFERERILEILREGGDAATIVALHAASLSGKLLQMAGGAIYDSQEKTWTTVHDCKLDALEELVETATSPVLIGYWFQHEKARILERLKKYGVREYKTKKDKDDWNTGKIKALLGHPAAMGYGLNLQQGGHNIVMFSSSWSCELDQQFLKRVHRQGQEVKVIVNRLVSADTLDERVIAALRSKADGQNALMEAIKARIEEVAKTFNKKV